MRLDGDGMLSSQGSGGYRPDYSKGEKRYNEKLPKFMVRISGTNVQLDPPPYIFDKEKVCTEPHEPKDVAETPQKKEEKTKEQCKLPVESVIVIEPNVGFLTTQPKQPAQPKDAMKDDLFDLAFDPPKHKSVEKPAPLDDILSLDAVAPKTQPVSVPQLQKPVDSISDMDGFNQDKFANLRKIVDEILAKTPDVDPDRILESLGDYSVALDLDPYRENPTATVLTEKLLEVHAKRDSLFSLTMRLTPLRSSMESAAKYITEAGLECSTASSKDKRLAQLKLAHSDFWIRHAKVTRASETVDRTFDHLEKQYESISRLITCLQLSYRVAEISRGELPFDPSPSQPRRDPPVQAPPPVPVNNNAVNRSMSQPLNPKFETLDDFSPVRPSIKGKFVSGEVDF
jgi:hypothetical protein